MKNEHSLHNKIIPVKSLVQKSRQSHKKHCLETAGKEPHNLSVEVGNTPKNTGNHYSNFCLPASRPSSGGHKTGQAVEKMKGIVVTNHHANQVHFGKGSTDKSSYPPVEEFYYSSKPERYGRQMSGTPAKLTNCNPERSVRESADMTPKKVRIDESNEERANQKICLSDRRESYKSVSLNRGSAELQKDSSFICSSKLEDETWNASRFQKILSSERETQPIFKNELTKIKTQLFQKEAQLFEVSQKLEERQATVKDLLLKLQLATELTRNLKSELSREGSSQTFKASQYLTAQIERLSQQIVMLTSESAKKRKIFEQGEENAETNRKLLLLKIRQFEFDERDRTQFIIELKEKERRVVESYEKRVNVQKELLRQKEEQLVQISQAAHFYKEEVSKNMEEIETCTQRAAAKEEVISQLSGEIADLKGSIGELHIRMREMIEREDDLRRQVENKDEVDQSVKEGSVKEFELSMMEKTCAEYKRKIEEYRRYSEEMRSQVNSMKRTEAQLRRNSVQNKQQGGNSQSIESVSVSVNEERSRSSPRKSLSPLKEGFVDEREFNKVRLLNSKLFKDNEKMNSKGKELSSKIHQFYKLNKGLNQVIICQDLQRLNDRFSRDF